VSYNDRMSAEQSYSDVIRESQEICELLLKAVLRLIGIEPPKFHDVGKILKDNHSLLATAMQADVDAIARYSSERPQDRPYHTVGWINGS
jgi:HEPN domain-containing protein